MLYRPEGVQIRIPFTVPALDGSNTSGLSWSVSLFTKGGAKVTTGTEFDSISVDVSNDDDFYEVLFTPSQGSEAVYLVKVISDAETADVFEVVMEPDYSWLFLYSKMVRDLGASPETLEILKPGGAQLIKFKVYRSGTTETREEL